MSEQQRSLWSETASMLSLSHTLPILRDEIEICLVTSSIFLVAFQTAGFKASLVTCMLLHLIRGGSRWQLIPTYFSVFVLSAVQGYSVALTVLHFICALLTLGLCYVIPCVPLMSGRGKSLGVQDLTFDGPSGKFWIKCFYPTYGTADKPQVANFPSPSKSWMIKAVVSFGTILCAASIMKYAELSHSSPSLLWFSAFSALHLCRLVYDAQYALPSCAYISASEFSSVVEGVAKFAMLPKLIFTHMSLMRVNCTKDAPVYFGENDSKLKVAFVLHGLGGTRDFYSFICMRLAAEGYFVISPEFSDGTACMSVFPDGFKRKYVTYVPKNGDDLACEGSHIFRGKQLEHRAEEMDIIVKFFSSLTDEKMSVSESASTSKSTTSPLPTIRWKRMVDGSESFFCKSLSIGVKGSASEGSVAAGVIDIKNPFIVGHSFGAATAVHLQRSAESYATKFRSHLNSISAIVALDPWMWPAVPLKDALDLTSLSTPDPDPTVPQKTILNPIHPPYLVVHTEYFQWPANMRQERDLVRDQDCAIHLRVNEAGHNNFSDTGFLSPYITGRLMKKTGIQDPVALQEMINNLLVTYLSDCATPDTPRSVSTPVPGECKGTSFSKTLSFAQAAKDIDILEARW